MKPFLKWAGGKRWLAYRMYDFDRLGVSRLVEPFVGSAAIFFRLEPTSAVLSDQNHSLISAYIGVRDDWQAVTDLLTEHGCKHSEAYYYEMRAKKFSEQAETAAQFIYLNRTCWNGLYRENKYGKFNVPKGTKDKVVLPTDNFELSSEMLKYAQISCSDFEAVIESTCSGDLLFVDPPYTVKHNNNGFRRYNEKIFSWDDQERLAGACFEAFQRGVKVVMTNAWHQSVIALYEGKAEITPLSRSSVLSGLSAYRVGTQEALITLGVSAAELLIPERARVYIPKEVGAARYAASP